MFKNKVSPNLKIFDGRKVLSLIIVFTMLLFAIPSPVWAKADKTFKQDSTVLEPLSEPDKNNFFFNGADTNIATNSVATIGTEFTQGLLTYQVLTEGKTNTVMIKKAATNIATNTIPSVVTNNDRTYDVTSIGDYAFYRCGYLPSITIPNSVTSIGELAFYECSALTFITIPDSVTTIGKGAFAGCTTLTSITIPNSVTTISESLFDGCTALKSISIGNSVTSIGKLAFRSCFPLNSITLPDSVTSIGNGAFTGCGDLTSITIPNSIDTISESLFDGCSSLKEITIPNSVTSIGKLAFFKCSGLTFITIPEKVTSIGERAFERCTGLTSISIPNSVKSIGYKAFNWCDNLSGITLNTSSDVTITNTGFNEITLPNSKRISKVTGVGNVTNQSGNTISIIKHGESEAVELANGQSINLGDHAWGEWSVNKRPTCTQKGEEQRTCTLCDKIETRKIPIDNTNHSWGEWIVTKQPTYTDKGEEQRTCALCGEIETREIEKLPTPSTPSYPTSSTPSLDEVIKINNGYDWIYAITVIDYASEGDTVKIDMSEYSTIPKEVIKAIKENKVTVSLKIGNDVTWIINGKDITTTDFVNIDLNVMKDTNAISNQLINQIAKGKTSNQLTLSHNGEFGFKATLSINLGKNNIGLTANLFYNNPITKQLEFQNSSIIDESGFAYLEFTHASDYVIIMDKTILNNTNTPITTSNPQTSDSNLPILPLLCMLIVASGLMIYNRKLKFK